MADEGMKFIKNIGPVSKCCSIDAQVTIVTILSLCQMLRDLYTFLEKAVPDTKLTLKKYSDAKCEFLVRYFLSLWCFPRASFLFQAYCLKVKEMDDEEYEAAVCHYYCFMNNNLYTIVSELWTATQSSPAGKFRVQDVLAMSPCRQGTLHQAEIWRLGETPAARQQERWADAIKGPICAPVTRGGGYSSAVERSLCMREASGSNPDISTVSFSFLFFHFALSSSPSLSPPPLFLQYKMLLSN